VRDLAADPRRQAVWLATWGGLLCWLPREGRCLRHTSEHGLPGNAVRAVAVDARGIVWACPDNYGLYALDPDGGASWQAVPGAALWRAARIAPRPAGGASVALRDASGHWALGEVNSPTAGLSLLPVTGPGFEDVRALLVEPSGTVWLGGLQGLCHYRAGVTHRFNLGRTRVNALAAGTGDSLLLGSDRGLYRFRSDGDPMPSSRPDWPRDEVVALAAEPESPTVWVATVRELGRIVGDVWQPLPQSPPGRVRALLAEGPLAGRDRAWAGGSQALYEVGADEAGPAFALDSEDALGNAVQCLGP
jgi:ligand-binding sensor domain-containing protein